MRICLLYSEGAGEGESQGAKLRRAIEGAGHDVTHMVEKDTELARALEDKIDLVVAAGGDGTVARAATALASQSIPLTVLPLGTANNIASSLGIEGTLDEIIRSWDTAALIGLDLGRLRVEGVACHFVEGVGGGLVPQGIVAVPPHLHGEDDTADIKVQRALRRYRDVLADLRPQRCTLTLDGEEREGEFLLLEVLNIPTIGPSLRLSQDVSAHDGLLSVVIAEERHRADIAAYLSDRAEGRQASLALPTWHAREVEVRGLQEAHVDDDVRAWPGETMSLGIEPAAVKILHPKPSALLQRRVDGALELFK